VVIAELSVSAMAPLTPLLAAAVSTGIIAVRPLYSAIMG